MRLAEPPSRLALVVVSVWLGVANAGCASHLPTAPDTLGLGAFPSTHSATLGELGGSAVSSGLAAKLVTSFDLVGGTFSVTTPGGDQLTGTYTGRAEVSASRPGTASLELRVVGGSGAFQGANGTLRGEGTGAFTGEGAFTLSLKGSLTLAAKPGASSFQTDIAGTARTTCTSGRISVTLQADGTSNRFGRLTEVLSHQVTNASCSS